MTLIELVYNNNQMALIENDQSIYSNALNDIAKGHLVSGDRLVTTQLAKRYNTSINPVREALKQLEGKGFVTFQNNSGARVAKFEYETMRNVFEMLQLLEPYFLTWFIEHITEQDIDKLSQILRLMKKTSLSDFASFRELDTSFHWQMYRHHYNQEAVNLWRSKKLVLQALHASLPISPDRFKHALLEHQTMLEYLKNGQGELAKKVLETHIRQGGEYWVNKFVAQDSIAPIVSNKAQAS